jgi:hypothetical protein
MVHPESSTSSILPPLLIFEDVYSLTWWMPDQMVEVNEPKLGQLRLRLWCDLHFQQSAKHSMHLIQVERLNEDAVSIWTLIITRQSSGHVAVYIGLVEGIFKTAV